ncbi:MAG: sulfur transferase domain-containing protein [Xanthomonadales bacterium]|nr:sulfur transferase domain-containing protein [Xanthomonadales bacterium]
MSTPSPRLALATALPMVLALALAVSGCATTHLKPAMTDEGASMQTPVLDRFTAPAEGIHAGGRISADDVPALRAAGIRHVIDLTPDAETPGFDEAGAVREVGMGYDNLPIAGPGDLDRAAVVAFDRMLQAADGPTLVHCASGNRVGALAALRAAWLQGVDEDEAVAEGRRWGLGGLEGAVRERLAHERCLADARDSGAVARCHAEG